MLTSTFKMSNFEAAVAAETKLNGKLPTLA